MLIADALLGRANESLELSIRHTQSIFFRFFLLREHVILAHYQKKRINTSCYLLFRIVRPVFKFAIPWL